MPPTRARNWEEMEVACRNEGGGQDSVSHYAMRWLWVLLARGRAVGESRDCIGGGLRQDDELNINRLSLPGLWAGHSLSTSIVGNTSFSSRSS